MLKFLGLILLLSASFASGYYFGQRPVGTLQHTVADLQQSMAALSRNVLENTTGIERDLRQRQALVDAKSRIVQAKAHLFERNFGEAAKDLGEAANTLDAATQGAKSEDMSRPLREVVGSLRDIRVDVSRGKPVSPKKLDAIQHRVDRLLTK